MSVVDRLLDITDIHQMTDYISNFLNKPVIIENKNFELIAYSSSGNFEFDLTQKNTILSKKCPSYIIERLEKDGIVQQLESKNDPIRIETIEDVGFYQRVVIKVTHKELTVGYIWVLESTNLLKVGELEFLTTVSSQVGELVYEYNNRNMKKETREQRLLRQIINHEYVSEKQIRTETNLSSIRLLEQFTVLVVFLRDFNALESLTKVKKSLCSIREVVHYSYVEDDSKIIIAVGASNGKTAIEQANQVIGHINQTLDEKEKKEIVFGMGNEYHLLNEMRKSFLQALEVIEVVNSINGSHELPVQYGKLGMYRYLLTMYEKNSSEAFINYDLLKLMNKDIENNSNLLKTLEVYLANNLRLRRTAKQLFIHPNTMNYRLKQILEITEIDLEDFNMNSHLYTELLLINNIQEYYQRYREAIKYNFP